MIKVKIGTKIPGHISAHKAARAVMVGHLQDALADIVAGWPVGESGASAAGWRLESDDHGVRLRNSVYYSGFIRSHGGNPTRRAYALTHEAVRGMESELADELAKSLLAEVKPAA
jgi:hypothetical protein